MIFYLLEWAKEDWAFKVAIKPLSGEINCKRIFIVYELK